MAGTYWEYIVQTGALVVLQGGCLLLYMDLTSVIISTGSVVNLTGSVVILTGSVVIFYRKCSNFLPGSITSLTPN